MSISPSRRKQRGAGLLELFLTLMAVMLAISVTGAVLMVSTSTLKQEAASERVKLLLVEIERAYPSGNYTGASAANVAGQLLPGSPLSGAPGALVVEGGSTVTLTPSAPASGFSSRLQIAFTATTPDQCTGSVGALATTAISVSIGGAVLFDNAIPYSTAEAAEACADTPAAIQAVIGAR